MGQAEPGGPTARRAVRLVGAGCALGCLVLAGEAAATAAPVGTPVAGAATTPFVPAHSPVLWPATMADGTPQSSTVTVDTAELGSAADLPGGSQLSAGQTYFYVALHPTYAFGSDPQTPIAMPTTAATLVTANGTVAGIPAPPSSFSVDASWYFPVTGTLTAATLDVASFTKVLGNERGNFTPWMFDPTAVDFVGRPGPSTAPLPARERASGAPALGAVPVTTATPRRGGTPVGVTLGAGAVGLVVLGAAGVGLVTAIRRRAFARADREGRIVLTGPPALVPGATVLAGAAGPTERRGIIVKLLGPLEVDGTERPLTAGPLLELVVFLALHPGRSFSSVQLRESIWGLGRQPITSNTFRKYMVQFRKAFGPGVVVTDVYRYELTDAVVSDWDLFRAALHADDELWGQEEALGLVRGPVLHGCFDGRKNSPFSWAVGTANDIEDGVTTTAVELALACLQLGDPTRAKQAVAQGLLCAETNLRLRTVELRVAAALGGPRELGRHLEAGRAAMATFPNDVAQLEDEARALGWVPSVPG